MTALCLIPINLQQSRLGLPARVQEQLAGTTVLDQTIRRAAAVPLVAKIVLVHPQGQNPMALIDAAKLDKPIYAHEDPEGLIDEQSAKWIAARKWALTAWRGGLGSTTVYDELLPATPLITALDAHRIGKHDSVLLVRGDWCLFDSGLAQAQLALHLEHPEAMKLVFTQAPPGLSGIAMNGTVLRQLAETGSSIGQVLGYNPHKPSLDPIGREVNHPIPASVRDCNHRFVYDTPRTIDMIQAIAAKIDIRNADAVRITNTVEAHKLGPHRSKRLPQQVTLELTPQRAVTGPITPQHYVELPRPDLELDLARRIFAQLEPDTALLLGGLGDALLHPQLAQVVAAAHDAQLLGIGLETDLLCDHDELESLLSLPIDLITVRFNADSCETYRRVMGTDGFPRVMHNLQWLFQQKLERKESLPWILPRLIKTKQTLPDLESFFERWMRIAGHAVIEPARCGCGLMPPQSPVPMSPPQRVPCRQLGRRMSILSDGTVALCDQDWLGRAPLGEVQAHRLQEIWSRVDTVADAHARAQYAELALCQPCNEWHRP